MKVRPAFIWDFSKYSHIFTFASSHCTLFLCFIQHRGQKYQIVITVSPPRAMKSKRKKTNPLRARNAISIFQPLRVIALDAAFSSAREEKRWQSAATTSPGQTARS